MTIANLDSSITFESSGEIDFPLSSFSSSLKVKMPFCFKAKYKWSVKLFRVSLPLKLRNTSYFHRGVKEEDDDDGDKALSVLMEAIEIILENVKPKIR